MNAVAEFDLVDDASTFFAPASSDMIDGLIGQYQSMRRKVERVADVMNGPDLDGALHYFIEQASVHERHSLSSRTVENLFDAVGAIAYLNASYWSKAMQLTDVLDVMPQKRRDEWNTQIRNPLGVKKDRYSKTYEVDPIPEFNEENVRSTLSALLTQRERFFAERVDGIFRSLSKTHVTNAPEGFGRRMIIAGAIGSYDLVDHCRAGVINDLRCVIAKFMGRDEPKWDASSSLIKYARERRGQWIPVDGGALRIRCYMVGTAHLEVHPDIAWRLNCVLAQLYPAAIPSQFRERPKKRPKDFKMMGRPLPFAVVATLSSLDEARDLNPNRGWRDNSWVRVPGCYEFRHVSNSSDQALEEAGRVLESIGGTPVSKNRWKFDYNPTEVVKEIVASGCVPDQKAHQFYPTPERLARIAVELADIGPDHTCLEPSAGIGGLADLMPKEKTVCVEVSDMHCRVLEAKGHSVAQADFLTWNGGTFHRVVMNPPFSEGRWQAHLERAAGMVRTGGRLVAILPSSAKRTDLPGFTTAWHGPYANEFPGTSVEIVILVAERSAA
ncbi:DUF4942 domain-containing protein [Aquabacterium sp.]|uniref:DUF4942 domain-containing protein n=1 Tax=Aquabacterium sp. TaxID=1872578 RepID=UPI0035AEED38